MLLLFMCTCLLLEAIQGAPYSRHGAWRLFHSQRGLQSLAEKRWSVNDPTIIAYLGGKIYTVDAKKDVDWDQHPQEAMIVVDGVIDFIGTNKKAEEILEQLWIEDYLFKVYDLQGSVILPGIHDIHMHPLEAMSPVGGTCMLPKNTDPESPDIKNILSECPPKQIGTEWILGHGHSITNILQHVIKGGRMPKEILDEFIPDKPAAIMEETSHSLWVNSEALRRGGITNTTAPRRGGIIMRGKHNEPNGILFENEVQLMLELALNIEEYPALEKLNYEGLTYAMEELSKNGITSICDARLYWKRGHQKAWKTACDNGDINARVILGLWAYAHPNSDDEQIEDLKNMYSSSIGKCDLRMSQIKMYSDGILDSYTGALFQPYSSMLEGMPGLDENKGLNYFDKTRMTKYIKALQHFKDANGEERGFDFNIHAIGDRGVGETLDAIEASQNGGNRGERHRITHVELTDPADRKRFSELGVVADFQVAGDFTIPTKDNVNHYKYLVGDRVKNFITVKSIVDADAVTTFSSDWDVSSINPFVGMEHATMRGDQSVSVKTAVEMYTINPAYAMRQEGKVGSLVKGKEADFIIIDQDILGTLQPGEKISYTRVLQTVFKGRSVYKSTNEFRNYVSDITYLYH